MISNPTLNTKYIWIGTWINPQIEIVYFLKRIPPQIAIAANNDLLTNPNFDQDPTVRYLWDCVWAHELYEYTPKLFNKFRRKINFVNKRESKLKKFEIPFSEIYRKYVEDSEKKLILLILFYYKIRLLKIFANFYQHWIYPFLNIYTHDLQTIFTYSSKKIELINEINKNKIELENIKSDWIYTSEKERIEASNLLSTKIKSTDEELQSSIKLLNDASRTLVSASIAFFALLFSIISFSYILSNKNAEIDKLKNDISILNAKNESTLEKISRIELENILLKSINQKVSK